MMRIRLKNSTNFVRRPRNRFAGNGTGFTCPSTLVGFIDEARQFFWKRHAEEPRGLEIDADLESLDRHGVERQEPFPVGDALCGQSGFPADIAVVDGYAEQRSKACELR